MKIVCVHVLIAPNGIETELPCLIVYDEVKVLIAPNGIETPVRLQDTCL